MASMASVPVMVVCGSRRISIPLTTHPFDPICSIGPSREKGVTAGTIAVGVLVGVG
jgi:hypothetical protein